MKATSINKAFPQPFSLKEFCKKFQVTQNDITRLMGYSAKSIATLATSGQTNAKSERRIEEMTRLFNALSSVMKPEFIGQWLRTKNKNFEGAPPLQIIERGESDRVWRLIYQLETGEPN